MSPQLHPTVEAPSDISDSPVAQYPSLYASHAYSGKSMVRRNSPAFTPGGPAWIMSVEQTLPSRVAKSKLPLGNGLCLGLPWPRRPQRWFGRGLLTVALSHARGHSCSRRAKTVSYQPSGPQPGTA